MTATLAAARDALGRHAWREAFEMLSALDAEGGLDAEGLRLLGDAAWWSGEGETVVEALERAFGASIEEGEPEAAAMVALQMGSEHLHRLAPAIAMGWFGRAERLLEGLPESVAHGKLSRSRAVLAFEHQGDPEAGLEHAAVALDVATRFGDRDLQAVALMDQGRILAAMGRVDEGRRLMDEAMVAAVGGEIGPFATGVVYCNVISSCDQLADYRRAGEWTEAAQRWCERQSISGFPGICRVHRAEIMRLRGAWTEAEAEARHASEELGRHNLLDVSGEAFYEIGEIRLRMGDLGAAEEAFTQAHELGREPQPGMAMLRLAQGRPGPASTGLASALEDTDDRLARVRLLPARVEVAVAAGEIDAAREAAAELEETAVAYGSEALAAASAASLGTVALAEGDPRAAVSSLRRALRVWQSLDAPFEAARTRVLLADAHRAGGDEEAAAMELGAARAVFERLGAGLDLRRLEQAADGRPFRVARTFMFTDIVRSTDLVEAIGDESWTELVGWHDRTLRGLFAEHRGEEVDHAGDGFFVAFPDQRAALTCAVAIQRRLAEHRRAHGFAPQVRIGVHATEAAAGGGAYRGKGVHQAARIAATGEGGQIVASEETVEAAGDGFEGREPREVALKGLAAPVRVVSVAWR
jgi:class 3 adenylate cyclase